MSRLTDDEIRRRIACAPLLGEPTAEEVRHLATEVLELRERSKKLEIERLELVRRAAWQAAYTAMTEEAGMFHTPSLIAADTVAADVARTVLDAGATPPAPHPADCQACCEQDDPCLMHAEDWRYWHGVYHDRLGTPEQIVARIAELEAERAQLRDLVRQAARQAYQSAVEDERYGCPHERRADIIADRLLRVADADRLLR